MEKCMRPVIKRAVTLLSSGLSLFGNVVYILAHGDTLTIIEPAFVGEIYLKYRLVAFVSHDCSVQYYQTDGGSAFLFLNLKPIIVFSFFSFY